MFSRLTEKQAAKIAIPIVVIGGMLLAFIIIHGENKSHPCLYPDDPHSCPWVRKI